jgi:NAD(P)-dependent dehydrogenase (short-subunit alcohol dehydrogenase family)
MQDFAGKVAVVTGAASGIGRALATAFGREGMQVVLADVDAEPLEETRRELEGAGYDVLARPTDVADAAQVEALRVDALAAFGAVHVIVNNAGISTSGPLWEATTDTWRSVLGVNLWGVINGVRAFVPMLVAQGEGYVVNTASMQGLSPTVGGGPYAVSKSGVVALSEVLALDLKAAGSPVGVSVLCPGPVATNISKKEEVRAYLAAHGASPASVADRVIAAMRTNQLYVLTPTDRLDSVEARAKTITESWSQ